MTKKLAATVRRVEEPGLREAALRYPEAGGKALRPVLAVLSCEAAGGRAEDADPAALSVELLHTFSLVHDDLMDEDRTRRGVAAVHEAHDPSTAILAGDALYALAFEVLGDLPEGPTAARVSADLARTARRLCEGQHLDMAYEETWPSTEAYEAMVDKKTAALFAAAARNGARVAEPDPSIVDTLDRAGRALGTAFQVHDDVLDLAGDEDALGKPVGSDLRAGKKTYPILLARERASDEDRARLEAVLDGEPSDEEVAWATRFVADSDALEAANARAQELLDDARRALEELEASPARETLLGLVDVVAERDR